MDGLRSFLREGTAPHHDRVDAAFSRFSFGDPASYGAFLTAHASVLGDAESRVDAASFHPGAEPRMPLLAADLAELGLSTPRSGASGLGDDALSAAEKWGMLYVLEGSRLGGGVLSGRVGRGMPKRYLSARHAPGAWRDFIAAMEQAPGADTPEWWAEALAGAQRLFQAFETAAATGISSAGIGTAVAE